MKEDDTWPTSVALTSHCTKIQWTLDTNKTKETIRRFSKALDNIDEVLQYCSMTNITSSNGTYGKPTRKKEQDIIIEEMQIIIPHPIWKDATIWYQKEAGNDLL